MSYLHRIWYMFERILYYGFEDSERDSELDTPLQTDSETEPEPETEPETEPEPEPEPEPETENGLETIDIQDMSSDDTIDNNTTSTGMQHRISHNVYDNV